MATDRTPIDQLDESILTLSNRLNAATYPPAGGLLSVAENSAVHRVGERSPPVYLH